MLYGMPTCKAIINGDLLLMSSLGYPTWSTDKVRLVDNFAFLRLDADYVMCRRPGSNTRTCRRTGNSCTAPHA
jgi:hypothetical protein